MAIPFTLLDQASEDALHKSRLLNVEEKPFKKISKRLLATPSPISITNNNRLPTPPPDTDPEETNALRRKEQDELRRFREDVQLDFAAFESSIARIQFLRASNERERERYASEKIKIEETAHSVKENTTQLRIQLSEAQKTLATRKAYDELANKITSNKALRPRDEQLLSLEKLRSEIEDLEREKHQYAQTWLERREQFGKLVEEGHRLRRLIRDEKEEAERREGMDDEGGEDGEGSTRGRTSLVGTPRPDGGHTPLPVPSGQASGGLTPGKMDSSTAESPPRTEGVSSADKTPATALATEQEDADMADEGELDESEELEATSKGSGAAMQAASSKAEDAMDMS
ncbi:hypothetical protein UCRPC4_g00537 [Phaeomoniella chlamydospora]|uniref:Tho complex subunit 7 n=1 Tax=Phaeomoniella chlamydospora TaxID=158046 RepID=A0A0G2GZK1_PHACM|nr:hypothetical protein UCRPC4_g00537 [Phaeomoniella chlamydospora]